MKQAALKTKPKGTAVRRAPGRVAGGPKIHRPSDPTKYDVSVVYYVTGEMKEALQQQAREAGLKLSDFLRARDRQLGVGGYQLAVARTGRMTTRGGRK